METISTYRTDGRGPVPCASRATRGFGVLEALVALAIFAIVLGIVLSVFIDFGKGANTESTTVEMQNGSRIALEELARTIQNAGYNIDRSDPYNPARWQRGMVFASPYVLAFNSDMDPSIGPLDSGTTLSFPNGQSYQGEAAAGVLDGAETYVYTIDADDNATIDLSDRTDAATGSYNPAADTPNPLDFALFRRIWGYDGSGYGGTLAPVTPYLFTNATGAVKYGDGTSPEPLFTYWLTEDLNADGVLSSSECVNDVIDTCPPAATRSPETYLWGDTNFDGVLSEAEKALLRFRWVGSPSWPKNPLVSAGSYASTTLTADCDPSSYDAYILHVADVTKFGPGMFVQVGTGANAETFTIENRSVSGSTIELGTDPVNSHPTGTTVTILPETLLRAIRMVQINFDAIMPERDQMGGGAAPGRQGHAGTRGLDYRVFPLRRSVDLRNLETLPMIGSGGSGPPTCPLTVEAVCGASPVTETPAYFPASAATRLSFEVRDSNGDLAKSVPVHFGQTSPSVGALSELDVKTGSDGKATVDYAPAGIIGDDVVSATATCANASQQLQQFSDTITVRATQLALSLNNDCLTTVSSAVPNPATDFTLQAENSSGVVPNAQVELDLAFDTDYLPVTPDYSTLEGELFASSVSQGTTDSTGSFVPVTLDTGGSGVLAGQVVLNKDTNGKGARLVLAADPVGGVCSGTGGTTNDGVIFYKLSVDSGSPASGCTEISPCIIPAGSLPPTVVASLSVNDQPVSSATVNFTKTDVHAPNKGESILIPGSSVDTDAAGQATVQVANNGEPTITAGNRLRTTVGASSPGDPGTCAAGNVLLAGLKAAFEFEGYAGECLTDLQQAWVVKRANDRTCMSVQNANSAGGCPLRPTGISLTYFQVDGLTPDPNQKIEKIEGGAIDSSASCSESPKLKLFDKGCIGRELLNGERWDFANISSCVKPSSVPDPGEFFVLANVDWKLNLVAGRRIEVTLYFECEGICPAGIPVQMTFDVQAP